MRRIRGFSEARAPVAIYEGRSYEALEDFEKAKASYEVAMANPAFRMEAVGRLALMHAGEDRCAEALPGLQELAAALPGQAPDDILDGRVHIALARCLLAEGRPEEALAAAADGAGRSDDELHKRYATYLAAIAAREAGSPVEPMYQDALESYDDLWASLGQEAVDDAQFEKELRARLE